MQSSDSGKEDTSVEVPSIEQKYTRLQVWSWPDRNLDRCLVNRTRRNDEGCDKAE